MKKNLDELFLLPKAPVAMPYSYWGEPEGWAYSSQMMLIKPSAEDFSKVEKAIKNAKPDEYDMDIMNSLYSGEDLAHPSASFLNLLSGEFRRRDHTAYLGSGSNKWDPDQALSEAKFLHFSGLANPEAVDKGKEGSLE